MSPVSRGRKAKKGRKAKARKSGKRAAGLPGSVQRSTYVVPADVGLWASAALDALMEEPERPDWFDASIAAVLDRAGVVLTAQGPRELEQAVAELVGAELYRALNEEHFGMWFDWLFQDLAESAAARVRDEASRPDGAWEGPWRLLHGLTSIGSRSLLSVAQDALAVAAEGLPAGAAAGQPEWLAQLPFIAATGEAWEMHDAYGTRFAVIAGFCYPGGADESVFLFDIDACGDICLVGAGVFDDVDQAAAAWRAAQDDAAADARPSLVETAERLNCLAYLDPGEEMLLGSEPRAVMDNWFRADRRTHDLAEMLDKRGMPLPEPKSLYHGIDMTPMEAAFTGWYERRHGSAPDPEVVGAVAEEWLEGALPGTWHAVSPHRAAYQLSLISDWIPGEPGTAAAKALLPEWVRWNGEQAGLAEHLIDRAAAAAAGAAPPSD
jgi:hypothetical protein